MRGAAKDTFKQVSPDLLC